MPARERKEMPFEVILKGRDRTAKFMYKYMRWWIRSNRESLIAGTRRAVLDSVLYGRGVMSWQMQNKEN